MPDERKVVKSSNIGMAQGLSPVASKEWDAVPSLLYFVKAVKEGNAEGINQVLSHIQNTRGQQTATDLAFLGKQLQQSNINDIAKRNVSIERNPELKKMYRIVAENPEVMDSFDFVLPQMGMQKSLATIR